MSQKKPTTIYRHLIVDSLKRTWHRKTLWVFGLFAVLVSSGSFLDLTIKQFQQTKQTGHFLSELFERSFIGFEWFSRIISELQQIGTIHSAIAFFSITMIAIAIILIALLSQSSLILGILHDHHLSAVEVRKKASPHLVSIFTIDVVARLFIGLLSAILALSLAWFHLSENTLSTSVVFFEILFFIPLILLIQIIAFLSVIHLIDKNTSIHDSLFEAYQMCKKHWLATFEYALIVFLCVGILGMIFVGLFFFLSIPYSIIYTLALLSGSATFLTIINVLSIIVGACVLFWFGGGIMTFQYSAWIFFYKQTYHEIHHTIALSKILRLFHRH